LTGLSLNAYVRAALEVAYIGADGFSGHDCMTSAAILRALRARQSDIRIGIIGAGAMGQGLLYQSLLTPGVRCVALADLDIPKALACCETMGIEARVCQSVDAMADASRAGVLPVVEDGAMVSAHPDLEVLVEATSALAPSVRFVETALNRGAHVVMMNSESDLIFGPWFKALADRNGVVCTSCDGDQHGVLKNLIDDMTLWGFELKLAGNIKGFLDIRANPVSIAPEADKRRLDHKMCSAYTDGTKLHIEMALLSNALDLRAPAGGMKGPRAAHCNEALSLFDLDSPTPDGRPVVDYVLGAEPGGGVFAIGWHDNPFQSFMMNYYKLGPGPNFVFYRPYHLCHVESMASIVQPVLTGEALLEQSEGFKTNVFAYAKKPLKRGETLDGIGGHACYGLIENVSAADAPGLPICLAEHVALTRDIAQDERITMADIEVPADRADFAAFARAVEASAALGR
jgi:predicted homoserine dehydrogenase-like protein